MRPRALLLLLLVAATVLGQTPPRLTETIDVSVVNLDVVVVDREGRRVHGLTRDDFIVLEDGEPREISNFSEVRSTTGEGSPADEAATSAAPERGRRLLLFLDPLGVDPPRRERLRAAILDLLDRAVRPGDLVSVTSWKGRLVTEVPFTGDHGAVRDAVDRVTRGVTADAAAGEARNLDLEQEWATAIQIAYEETQLAAGEFDREAFIRMSVEQRARYEYAQVARRTAALSQALVALAGVDARKALLVASTRLTANAAGPAWMAAGEGHAPADPRWDTTPLLDRLAEAATAADVAIYAVQPQGVPAPTNSAAIGGTEMPGPGPRHDPGADLLAIEERKALSLLASRTGGLVAFGPVETERLIRTLADDLGSYYSLGYRASGIADGRPRRIEVRTRRGLEARTRRTIVEKTPLARAADQVLANLFHPLESSEIPIALTFAAPRREAERTVVPIQVRIPIGEMTLLERDGVHRGGFSLLVATASGAATSAVDVRSEAIAIPAADVERARASHYTYSLDVEMDKEAGCCISVGVLDGNSGELGLAMVDLDESTVVTTIAPAPMPAPDPAAPLPIVAELPEPEHGVAPPSDPPAARYAEGYALMDEYFARAAALSQQGALEEAVDAWRKVLQRTPRDPLAHYNLGLVHLQRGDLRAAARSFEESIRLNPDNDIALFNLAWTYSELGNRRRARRAARRALEINPAYEKAQRLLAELQTR